MKEKISDLIAISHYYGNKKDYVIAGGGNTSFKNESTIWVKASGVSMNGIKEENFAVIDRSKLQIIYQRHYSNDAVIRESQVKADLQQACISGPSIRPSVETSLHELIRYSFVVHTHPTLVNAITCSNTGESYLKTLFKDTSLYIPYTDPGYTLFMLVSDALNIWRSNHTADPKIIFLQNHGVFVAADTISEIRNIYESIEQAIKKHIKEIPETGELPVSDSILQILPALRMIFSQHSMKVARIRNSRLIQKFTASATEFSRVSLPFSPDQIVYCKARPVYLESEEPESLISECRIKTDAFLTKYGYMPRIVGIRNIGLIAFDDHMQSVDTMLDVFTDWMLISSLSENFGGPHFMSEKDIEFIDNWEVENYRRQVASLTSKIGRVENKIVIITGAAQGFGEGIATALMQEGANVVIADINEEKGMQLAAVLNKNASKNEAVCIKTDVTEPASVQNLIKETVRYFGGLDIYISNAGILRAGGLNEMTPETFELITKVNYSAYFLGVKYASEVMKLQASYNNDFFTDIIQINSKSGIKGSNRNFAYAGGKFGGIGLTQSFALELMPYHIKVNSICPGNFFEGPLWSDPETGLFVQYLKAGKVPGAKTIEDVKLHYENQVPAGRGCRVADVMRAIFYVIEQEYETGQAVPVTGGQEMLK